MPALWKRVEGRYGRIEIPDLGALIANTSSWTLTRRGNVEDKPGDPEAEFFDLHAVLSFVNTALFNDPEYTKEVLLQRGKGRMEQVVQEPGQRTVLTGRSLVMEKVKLCRVDR